MNLITIVKDGRVLKAVEVRAQYARDPNIWRHLTAMAHERGLTIQRLWMDKACNHGEMRKLVASNEGD